MMTATVTGVWTVLMTATVTGVWTVLIMMQQ